MTGTPEGGADGAPSAAQALRSEEVERLVDPRPPSRRGGLLLPAEEIAEVVVAGAGGTLAVRVVPALAAGAAPAAALEAAIDPLDAARCAAYGGGGAVVADADAGSGGPRLRDCVLPTVPTSEVLGGSLRPLFERLDLDVVQVVDDPANDLFSLTTGEVGSGDPATDVNAASNSHPAPH